MMERKEELCTIEEKTLESDEEIKAAVTKFRNDLSEIQKGNKSANEEAEKLMKTYNYGSANKLLKSYKMKAIYLQNDVATKLPKGNLDRASLMKSLDDVINDNSKKIKSNSKSNLKKQVRRFDNKYWIDYTKKHQQAFKETEKELLGHNTKAGEKHDMDKYIMYHFLPAPLAHALHTQFAHHHKRRAKTKEDYIQMMIDMESNRKTKPDKQMKPYQVIDKFYPDLKDKMYPILKEYGLPTSAEEEREMEKNKQKENKDK
jgi:hypothetical protein